MEIDRHFYGFKLFKICYDGHEMVYLVSGVGEIMAYNLDTDKWTTLTDRRYWSHVKYFTAWIEIFDKNSIYYMTSDGRHEIELRYFNIKDRKWKRRNGYNAISKILGNQAIVLD